MTETNRGAVGLTREDAVAHAVASARIEGIELDQETRSVLAKWAATDLTTAELDKWVDEQIQQARATNQRASGRRASARA